MKKTTAAAFAAGMVLCSVAFTACKTEGNSATKGQEDTYTVIADFESWAPSFQLMRIMNGFGKVTENNDGAFVRSGKGSAKLQPLGYYAQSSQPYLYFPLYSQKFGRDKTDFSKVKKITASIYCANETGSVEIGLISSVASVSSAERVQNREYKLNRGWNDLVYEVDLNILNIAYDITAMQGVSFAPS